MTIPRLSAAAMAIVDWLGELGPRWGLPQDACRIHAFLYLTSRPIHADAIGLALRIDAPEMDAALAWLAGDRLVESTPIGWITQTDPWALMTRALDARRALELAPAREVLRGWRNDHEGEDPVVTRQARRLFELVEDIAAIEAGTRRLSPDTMRRLVGIGGRAARFVDRTFGGKVGKG